MEIHKNLILDGRYNLSLEEDYINYFRKALEFAKEYYSEDVERISTMRFDVISPEEFFREYTWCVYTSGFNAKIVSRMFPALREVYAPLNTVFCNGMRDINTIDIATNALAICNNKRKVKSIIDMAFAGGEEIKKHGWVIYRNMKLDSPDKLQNLPFIGPITCYHLARNIGLLDFIKPDLHLVRMANNWKFETPVELCKSIQKEFNLPLGIIDLVLWYAASTFGTNEKSNSNRKRIHSEPSSI